jgi:peptidoglycan/xylan/chitin deacetylase (PgdA/CDA1 family)
MKELQVLAYHRILPSDLARPRGVLAVTTDNFERQMKHFLHRGWQCLTLSQLQADYLVKGEYPRNTFVVTFDDGYRDNYIHAFPILKRLAIKATVFVTTAYIGKKADLYFSLEPRKYVAEAIDQCLSPEEIKEMSEYGIEFGSHSHTHPHLTAISQDQVRQEVRYSKSLLEQLLAREVVSFCFPFGDLNSEVVDIVRQSGYLIGVVTPSRSVIPQSPLTIHRTGIYFNDSHIKFLLKSTSMFHRIRETGLWRFAKTL